MPIFGRLIIWFMVAVLLMGPSLASAQAIDGQMGQLFTSWGILAATTPPGAYQGQTRNALTGGSLEVRFQTQPTSLLTISPPRLGIGCGGIDIYLGGFSYGSLSRYVTLLTQLGTGAVLGYAFQLAMKFICPDCADVLNKLEAAARALNTAARLGPCNAGQALKNVMKASDALGEVASSGEKALKNYQERIGSIGDTFEGQDLRASMTTAAANAITKGTESDVTGNLVWLALGNVVPAIDDGTRTMMMSLFGTVVVDNNMLPHYHPPTLRFADVMDTRVITDSVEVLSCLDGPAECLNVTPAPSLVGAISGFQERVEVILDAMMNGITAGTAVTASDINFINSSAIPIYKLLADYGKTPFDRESIKGHARYLLSASLALSYMQYVDTEIRRQAMHFRKTNPEFMGDVEQYLDNAKLVMTKVHIDVEQRSRLIEGSKSLVNYLRQNPPPRPRR